MRLKVSSSLRYTEYYPKSMVDWKHMKRRYVLFSTNIFNLLTLHASAQPISRCPTTSVCHLPRVPFSANALEPPISQCSTIQLCRHSRIVIFACSSQLCSHLARNLSWLGSNASFSSKTNRDALCLEMCACVRKNMINIVCLSLVCHESCRLLGFGVAH